MTSELPDWDNPIVNAVFDGICGDLNYALDNKRPRTAVILLMVGIDAMGHITRDAAKHENTPDDFKRWVGTAFAGTPLQRVRPIDWWASRNSVLHTYGDAARDHRAGKARDIVWMCSRKRDRPLVCERAIPGETKWEIELFQTSELFCAAVQKTIKHELDDSQRSKVFRSRLNKLMMMHDLDNPHLSELRDYLYGARQ